MVHEMAVLLGKAAALNGRLTEIGSRMHRDALLLVEVRQELERTVDALIVCQNDKAPPGPILPTSGPRMLRFPEVSKRVGLGRSSIWSMVKAQQFPKPHRLSAGAVGWLDFEIDEWVRTRELANARTRNGGRTHRA